jgi:hypothetical protein
MATVAHARCLVLDKTTFPDEESVVSLHGAPRWQQQAMICRLICTNTTVGNTDYRTTNNLMLLNC